jgi:RHS repeat-associated protein
VYDPDGVRLTRKTPTNTTLYIEGQELTLTGTTLTTKRYYTLGSIMVAVRDSATALTYLLGDQLGSITVSISSTGGTPVVQRYLPYGAPRSTTGGTAVTDRGWIGQTKDTSTGLQYLNARYYDPTIGRFTAVDPVVGLGAGSLDRYGYSLANPISMSDPSGLCPAEVCPHGQIPTGLGDPAANYHPATPQEQADAALIGDNRRAGGSGNCAPGSDGSPRFQVGDACGVVVETGGCHGLCAAADMVLHVLPGYDCYDFVASGPSVGSGAFCVIDGVPVVGKFDEILSLRHLDDAADARKATNTADDVIGAVCSFSAETRVLMADGTTRPISGIEIGDEVLALDPETGERGPRKVTHLWVHQDDLIDLEIGGARVATTEDHPFWNETDRRWERADSLDQGDLVLMADGGRTAVGRMAATSRSATAYNLTVDEIHTYFVSVGSKPVLVHNTCGDFLSKPGQIANRLGATTDEVNDAIHAVKKSIPPGAPVRNPNVVVDAITGEVYPQIPGGGLGDSIGNIFDHLPGAG